MMFNDSFNGKRVWLSGHTGFKGSWLSEWLLRLGADVRGFALPPDTSTSLFEQLHLPQRITHQIGDIRDARVVRESIVQTMPDFIFHLAAQPLVRRSYVQPIETYETNVNGTLNVLEALRSLNHPCTALFITSDKCYENREHGLPYKEEDHLGGRDPYSSSKGMAEIAVAAYRQSYFSLPDCPVRIASARAGNVIGGGDWAQDRIVPDSIRALASKAPIQVRNPSATRPWQHVLEPLSGYLCHAARLSCDGSTERALNFGPLPESNRSVKDLVVETLKHWPGTWIDGSDPCSVHEARLLSLCIDKADKTLGWRPVWNFETTIAHTVAWYRSNHQNPSSGLALLRTQIQSYCDDARASGLGWTT
jgi:CDP-glucose 4,6-dehydratase